MYVILSIRSLFLTWPCIQREIKERSKAIEIARKRDARGKACPGRLGYPADHAWLYAQRNTNFD